MKSLIFILLSALFLGSAAYLGNMFLFDNRHQSMVLPTAAVETPAQVALRLTRSVKASDILQKGMLEWQAVPDGFQAGGLLVKGKTDMASWPGAVLTRDLAKGSFLEETQLVLPTDPGYVKALLRDGMRARPVAIDNIGEFDSLRSGDLVDLILTYTGSVSTGKAGETIVKTILESARIIATGGSSKSGALTLALSPEDVELVSVAEAIGRLRISLRGEDATAKPPARTGTAVLSASDLFPGLKSHPRVIVQESAREVRIFRGGETSVLTLTGTGQ
ncbi:MAG: Flp pilus assembly protein CpaB [Sneathiella sp.]